MSRQWPPPGPVPGRDDKPRRGDPTPIRAPLDRLLGSLGAPSADALSALFERWSELAGLPLADHGEPVRLDGGVLTVVVREPAWATEWRYRQGELLRRCDDAIGEGVVTRVEVRVQAR